eukprot:385825_1
MNKIHLLLFTLLPVFAKKKADQTVWSKFAMEIDATTGNVKWNVELDTAATKAQFESIDTSKDGKIDEKEVFAKMKQMSQDTSTFKPSDLIGLGDKNKDGTIDLEEFKAMLPLTGVFNAIDQNHDGKLSKDEFMKFYQNQIPDGKGGEAAFAKADADKSKYLDYSEFLTLKAAKDLANRKSSVVLVSASLSCLFTGLILLQLF